MKTDKAEFCILLAMLCCSLFALSVRVYAETDDEILAKSIIKATATRDASIPKASQDPYRPMYHYRPPARWMNDICGTVYYKGYHHIFYQGNPYRDDSYGWGWGHARSKDLSNWEEMPYALPPMSHRGELRCNSGNIAVTTDGTPHIFYTWVPKSGRVRTQWIVEPLDDELIKWRRIGDEPIMEIGKDGIPEDIHPSWSDPYVFKKDGRTFVTFKKVSGMVCEAQNKELTEWEFLGYMEGVAGECPNVFDLDGKYVILRSTHPLSYLTGDLILKDDDISFKADGPALPMDYGYGKYPPVDRNRMVRGLYGTNTYVDDKGRRIMFGWISGFKDGRGWNGCMSLPRVLTLDKNNRIIQTPAPELQDLRGKHINVKDFVLNGLVNGEFKLVDGAEGDQLEVIAEFAAGNAEAFGLKLRSSKDGQHAITMRYANGILNVAGTEVPLKLEDEQKTLKLQVFLDRSVLEVFINDGLAAVTRVEYPDMENLSVGVFAKNGAATVKSLDVWQMKSIW